jgi:hypothetical protein
MQLIIIQTRYEPGRKPKKAKKKAIQNPSGGRTRKKALRTLRAKKRRLLRARREVKKAVERLSVEEC